jgi:predicted nucleic acid-binding protein
MPTQFKVVIADTSCFILLDKIGEIDLLKNLFKEVVTTPAIAGEFGKQLPPWIKVENISNQNLFAALRLEVDAGEASAIALGSEIENSILVLDDLPARRMAEKLRMNYTGTLGIIVRAKRENIIHSVIPIVEKIKNTNFRFSEAVLQEIIKAAGESE